MPTRRAALPNPPSWASSRFATRPSSTCVGRQGTTSGPRPLINASTEGADDVAVKAVELPPAWDVGATACHDCKKEFSGSVRRRFCRACGLAHCSPCSPRSVLQSRIGFAEPVRVCNSCFNGITSAGGFKNADGGSRLDDGIIIVQTEQKKSKGGASRRPAFRGPLTNALQGSSGGRRSTCSY